MQVTEGKPYFKKTEAFASVLHNLLCYCCIPVVTFRHTIGVIFWFTVLQLELYVVFQDTVNANQMFPAVSERALTNHKRLLSWNTYRKCIVTSTWLLLWKKAGLPQKIIISPPFVRRWILYIGNQLHFVSITSPDHSHLHGYHKCKKKR